MKSFFPSRTFEFHLNEHNPQVWERLKNNTERSNSLVSMITNRKFIGTVEVGHFRLISSVKGKGALCIIEGNVLENSQVGIINIHVHKVFKVLIFILCLMPVIASLAAILQGNVMLLLPTFLIILFMRYFFLVRMFNSISQKALNDLGAIMWVIEFVKMD